MVSSTQAVLRATIPLPSGPVLTEVEELGDTETCNRNVHSSIEKSLIIVKLF